ncbi:MULTISPECIES: NAD-dependent epimerase/dehydratase family protein [Paraburkholderia]|uniref:NAD-dependent epimerase/dehydratase family protein n=1 Tax=Paraburkholderia TaxID=1822464 RepID=UPI00224CE41E|nr:MULTISPECIES: NAD-dependent epimerase/dehydratase family protein [Paraburkholderia]MCX4176111.1 NAD-dependent epimerase/dehydratase family protein [Paraburkholderia madseniana]MDQ6464105.1 NAD-dependent epimerase/dehydratase family protein [Paraburkholderia madseniana]
METILITGGLGFIGLNLAEQLVNAGSRVRLFDNLSAQIHGALPSVDHPVLASPLVEVMRGDVGVRADLERAVEGVDAIVHLAAETGTAQSMYQMAHYNHVNTQGTALLLEVLQQQGQHKVRKILLASSRSVYGEGAFACPSCSPAEIRYPDPRTREALAAHRWDPACPVCNAGLAPVATSEQARIHPASIYAATKFAQEELIRIGAQALGIASVVLRLQNVYGEGQSLNNPYTGILSIFSTRIRQNKSLPIYEDGLESRDFVHVSDVARAFVLALNTDVGLFDIFNVGLGEPVSVMDIASKLAQKLGSTITPHITAEYRVGDIRHCYADITRTTQVLGYTPQVGIDEGLERFVAWVRTQPLPEDRLEQANEELRRHKLMA